ncbi:hypothetical protein CAPTEDRAFT_226204 [Capitella teleta]|uniref:phosphatidylinositol-3,5-bisphosphate 3-phosphatase n=1 Tax=Capitella teleta TaxID=283909 RepID=R7U7A0_CAPTE|nr:hypothetical protein CAPTEDRAFT_226204 [Capitella teleta]|eukprot:ELT99015.1 hypothetical protein CAPTEDRAFT_226204 [Capitella teleta]
MDRMFSMDVDGEVFEVLESSSAEECLSSLEHIQASELYPKRPLVSDDEHLQVPFPVLHGESVEFLGRTTGGAIAVSNYRLFIQYVNSGFWEYFEIRLCFSCKETFVNIPLGMIESIEARDIFYLFIYSKDAHTYRCTFQTNEACVEWNKRLKVALLPPDRLQDVFAFSFHAWCKDSCPKGDAAEMSYQLCRMNDFSGGFSFDREVERLGFDLKHKLWRITFSNDEYRVCKSYPKLHIVPHNMTDASIERVAEFRGSHRFPSVVWRDRRSGAVIARSSQPEVGWLGWRSEYDEQFLKAIVSTCALALLQGFRVLIEREWLQFGHKFADRCGQGMCMDDLNERCPIFLQWLDCVHQLILQFPCEFQFNETCLVKLAHHAYSCLFGTFLCNNARERDEAQLKQQTTSVWTLLENQRSKFINRVFRPGQHQVLRPSHHLKDLVLWRAIYLSDSLPASASPAEAPVDESCDIEALLEAPLVSKTRSCENLKAAVQAEKEASPNGQLPRRLSDTNLGRDTGSMNSLLVDSVSSEKRDLSKDSSGDDPAGEPSAEEVQPPEEEEDARRQLRPHESSTDTLTEDQQVEWLRSSAASQGTPSPPVMTNGHSNGHSAETELDESEEQNTEQVHMSTSTSDLTDSRVGAMKTCHPLAGCSKLNEALLTLQIKQDAPPLPNTSSNPSSSPPTPAADLKGSIWAQNQVGRLIDLDGLTCHMDPVQQRLAQIEADYQQQLRQMERQLLMHKKVLHQYATAAAAAAGCNGCQWLEYDDMFSTESADSGGDHASAGSSTGASSDVSWEQVEEREAQITLWMPDHAVTHCAGCDSPFSLVRRKHHCRNCGQVFCHECTNFTVPVPQQHLNTPVRVCRKCYHTFGSSLILTSNGFMEHDAVPPPPASPEDC